MGTGDGRMMLLAKKTGPVAAKYWGKILATAAALACAWLSTKTDDILAGRNKRDEDIVQLQQAVDTLLEKNAAQDVEIAVLRTILDERTEKHPVVTAAAPQPRMPKRIDEVKVDPERVKIYQESRK